MRPKVAIIYLAYNSRPYLEDVAISIERLNYPKEDLLFVIVDNDSPDKSAEVIRETILPRADKTLPAVAFFPMETNLGFAAGNNIGIEHALLAGYEYVYLLNNDAKFHPDAIKEAVALAERDPKIGSVQSFMTLWQDPSVINSTGGAVHVLGFGYVRDNGMRVADVARPDGEEIAYASGAAVLYRARALREVGLLDPHLFLYHEDLQLGWRLRLAGWKNVFSLHSIAYHKYEFSRSIKKFFWMERNRILVHASYLKWRTLALLALPMLALEVALFGFALKGGWWKEKLLVWRALLSPASFRYVREARRTAQALRTVPDREILRLFTGKILHQETSNPLVEMLANPLIESFTHILRFLVRW